ncbi:MAG: hypothetical protein Q8O24_05330, partial [Gallionellaceae bacterium]|nr:hypothetical protein [Gallionellaceae bacterium]
MNSTDFNSHRGDNVLTVAEVNAATTPLQHQLIRTIFSTAELADIVDRAKIRSYQLPLLHSLGLDDCEVIGLYECSSPTGDPKTEKLSYDIATHEWTDQGEENAHGIGMLSLMAHINRHTEMEAANVLKDLIDGIFKNPWPTHRAIPLVASELNLSELEDRALRHFAAIVDAYHFEESELRGNEFVATSLHHDANLSRYKINLTNGDWAYDSPSYEAQRKASEPGYVPTQKFLSYEHSCGSGVISYMAYMLAWTRLDTAMELQDWLDHNHPQAVHLSADKASLNTLYGLDRLPNDLSESVVFTTSEKAADAI